MNIEETEQLLRVMEAYERSSFPDGAAELVWRPALARTLYADAEAAVHKHFRTNARDPKTGQLRKLLPAEVARVAEDIAQSRRRTEARKAVEGTRPVLGPAAQTEKTKALLASIRQKIDRDVERYHGSEAVSGYAAREAAVAA